MDRAAIMLGIFRTLSESSSIAEESERTNDQISAQHFEDENPSDNDSEEESKRLNDQMMARGPEEGMEFDSFVDLYAAYQEFAKSRGFGVSIKSSRDRYCILSCDRVRKSGGKKYTKRVNCQARIIAKCNGSSRWKVSNVKVDHNHELDPSMSLFMARHMQMTTSIKVQLETNDMAGLSVCKNYKLLQPRHGGPQNLNVNERDCRNFIDERRRLRLGQGDASAIRRLFLRLQTNYRRFFHLMDIDNEGQLRNIMWIHPRSRAAYQEFNDVLSFDTTYLVNRYHMPFATIVGVNHHNQSILLGCALLSHHHADSFKWFFTNWLEAMGGMHHKEILTDQCESIKLAIREVMPQAIHQFCLWHILYKNPMKFKAMRCYSVIAQFFKSIVYNNMSTTGFEEKWAQFLTEFGLESHRWLKNLWNERKLWAPIYLNHLFWAGMKSTQRSESMHVFFDGHITTTSTLKMFVE